MSEARADPFDKLRAGYRSATLRKLERTLTDYAQRNRDVWDAWAAEYAEWAPRAWAGNEPSWGEFSIPDRELGALPESVEGMDAIELGCGTAYFSAWLAKLGAHPVGIDNSPNQLETARRMQAKFEVEFPLHLGNAEELPFPDASFDLAISEYGASIWCDPNKWIPEAARVLRPGGQLVFLVNGLIKMLCTGEDDTVATPVDECLRRPYFEMHRFEWPDDDSVEFHLGYGDWIRLLRANDFEIVELIELRPPVDSTRVAQQVPLDWARQWPCEEIWKVRKRD
ncbi:MAG: class I SAM-dependent methyltransferase [Chloroflexia bacterium]|nr:class I SAM-dependent methyltransferase [Chloroflexia bacterium]